MLAGEGAVMNRRRRLSPVKAQNPMDDVARVVSVLFKKGKGENESGIDRRSFLSRCNVN
jgi:hypothetical protein